MVNFCFRLRRGFGAAWKNKSESGKMKAKADEKLVVKVLVRNFDQIVAFQSLRSFNSFKVVSSWVEWDELYRIHPIIKHIWNVVLHVPQSKFLFFIRFILNQVNYSYSNFDHFSPDKFFNRFGQILISTASANLHFDIVIQTILANSLGKFWFPLFWKLSFWSFFIKTILAISLGKFWLAILFLPIQIENNLKQATKNFFVHFSNQNCRSLSRQTGFSEN